MSLPLLVDTDVISYGFNRHGRFSLFQAELVGRVLLLSFMTVAELEYGAARSAWGSRRIRTLRDFIEDFTVVHSTTDLCLRWEEVMASSERTGRRMAHADAWIAATALELGCPLLTGNRKDYQHLAELELVP